MAEIKAHHTPGLPSEQHAALVGRQKIERLYRGRASEMRGASTSSSVSTRATFNASRSSHADMSKEQRLYHSEMRAVTRKALGPSSYSSWEDLGFSDRSAGRGPSVYGGHWDYHDEGPPIPQKYIDEFNQMWHESDEDNNAEQYMADVMKDAPWRKHQPIHPLYAAGGEFAVPDRKYRVIREPCPQRETHTGSRPRVPERSADAPSRPQPMSKFSFDSDCAENFTTRRKTALEAFTERSDTFAQSFTKRRKSAVD